MFRKISLVLMVLLLMLVAAGCWDSYDISERSVVLVAAVDLNREDGSQFGETIKYDATILMPNLSPESPNKVRIEKVSGASTSGSRDQRAYINPEIILVRMVRVFLIGEELAASGLLATLDTFYRNPLLSNSLNMAITMGQASEVISVQPDDSPDLGIYLKEILGTVNKKSFFPIVTLHDFQIQSTTKGKNPVLPLLRVDNGEVKIAGLGIFKKDRLIRQIGLDESRSLALLRGCKSHGYIPFSIIRENEMVYRGTLYAANNRQVQVERRGDAFTFNITIILNGDLVEYEAPVQLLKDNSTLPTLEEQIATDIETECQVFIEKMQEDFKLDCIDISKYALAKWRNELVNDIDTGFIEKVNINVDVKVRIRNTGDII